MLAYQGQEYTFEVEGRGNARQVHLVVDGGKYAIGATSNGDMGVPTSAIEVRQRIYSHDPLTRGDMDHVRDDFVRATRMPLSPPVKW